MDNLRIYLSTWNVATNSPNEDLNALLDFPSVENKNHPLPDFYCLAFQEVKSQPHNVVMDSLFSDPWTAGINKILARNQYVRVKSIRLQGLLLLVFCLRKHLVHLRDLETQYTRTGLGGMWGNKGAVSIRLSIYGCSICVVNSHLTPHDHQNKERVEDYSNIIKSNTFTTKETSCIMYHDYVFWMGDLNFRLSENAPESPSAVLSRIAVAEKDDFGGLLHHDQLRHVMATGEAFSELTEALPRFPPTYKFEIGSNNYDQKRRPAWTDRILYKVIPDNYENVTLKADQLNYHSLPQYTVSDHKPVVSEFSIKIRTMESAVTLYGKSSFSDGIPEETIYPTRVSTAPNHLESVRLWHPQLGYVVRLKVMGEEGDGDEEVGKYLAIQIWSPNMANAISSNVSILNGGFMAILQVFSNYTERCVEFQPIDDVWYIGDSAFRAKYTLSNDVIVNPNDWIAVYEADFDNLDDYITYEYAGKVLDEVNPDSSLTRTIVFSFPVGSGVRSPGRYRFLYFSQPSSDVRSLLGISNSFEVRLREDENTPTREKRHSDVALPSTSSSDAASTSSGQESQGMESFMRGFSQLHIPGLKFNMVNDLGID